MEHIKSVVKALAVWDGDTRHAHPTFNTTDKCTGARRSLWQPSPSVTIAVHVPPYPTTRITQTVWPSLMMVLCIRLSIVPVIHIFKFPSRSRCNSRSLWDRMTRCYVSTSIVPVFFMMPSLMRETTRCSLTTFAVPAISTMHVFKFPLYPRSLRDRTTYYRLTASHSLKFPPRHRCRPRSLHDEMTFCRFITLIVPIISPREKTHRCLTTLIVPLILMIHIFKFPLCPRRSPRSMWEKMSCWCLTSIVPVTSTMCQCSLKFPLRLHRTTCCARDRAISCRLTALILPAIIVMPSLKFLLLPRCSISRCLPGLTAAWLCR